MTLPLQLPIAPMLAKSAANVPAPDAVAGGYAYEPKWDGFRAILARDGDEITIQSRNQKDLGRYFPEVVAMVAEHAPERCILDGEIVVRKGVAGAERLDWDALSQRIHPAASRIEKQSLENPAEVICFDLLALGDVDLTGLAYRERRAALEAVFATIEPSTGLHMSAMTRDHAEAVDWLRDFEGAGLDGVIAKPLDGIYRPGERTMVKIKHARTADAVVTGYRIHRRGHGVGSLMLGLYDDDGNLLPVGGIGALSETLRSSLIDELDPFVLRDDDGIIVPATKPTSRFSAKKDAEYVPLRPELVVEVAFDQLEGMRFRHAVTLVRFRPDRDPESCLIDQIERPATYDLARVLDW